MKAACGLSAPSMVDLEQAESLFRKTSVFTIDDRDAGKFRRKAAGRRSPMGLIESTPNPCYNLLAARTSESSPGKRECRWSRPLSFLCLSVAAKKGATFAAPGGQSARNTIAASGPR
jgi:hypothetical protein